MSRKVRKADDSLLFPQAVWRRSFDSMVSLLKKRVPNPMQSLKTFIRAVKLSDLNKDAVQLERQALSFDPRPDHVQLLLAAFQIKKLNEGDQDETEVLFSLKT